MLNTIDFNLPQTNTFIKYKLGHFFRNLVHTGNLQFLAMFYNLAANEHRFLPRTSKISINTT